MVASVEEARKYCHVSEPEAELMLSTQSPIVLLKKREDIKLSAGIAPGLKYLGLILPYTPLHHLLMKEAGIPLVMTSGNSSEEPIAQKNAEALYRLGSIVEYFLWHDRDIYVTYDDSVVMQAEGETRVIRRARGYAPYPVQLKWQLKQVLACGAEMKGSFCFTRDNHAFLSQHIGDLENQETLEHFENTIGIYERLFRIKPEIIAHDLHPDYLSTRYAEERANSGPPLKLFTVQHHHAHIASCMAENGVESPVIGVAMDGTGYGTDGNIWGGEFILADYKGFERLAHLEYVPLPGGDAATKKPVRIAAAYLYHLLGEEGLKRSGVPSRMGLEELSLLKQQVDQKLNSPLTSSCGRLFDAVSSLLDIRDCIDYEAQAAIELEMCATDFYDSNGACYPLDIVESGGQKIIRLGGLFDAILQDTDNGRSRSEIAYRFHNSLAACFAGLCETLSKEKGIRHVALSGGVFQNRLLFHLVVKALEEKGLNVLTHKQVPSNDGGIALGQAVIAGFARI
jgi:hydrogenase maturation protein HypF